MIVSHRAPSSLNMSSYRAIWTHFRQKNHDFHRFNSSNWKKLLASGTGPRQIHHRFTTDPPQIHERCIIIRLTIGSRWILVPKSWLWVHKIVLTGGLPAPQTPWRGACSPPCPPAYREAPPLGLSVDLGTKILVPRSWYQDPGTKILGTKILVADGLIKKYVFVGPLEFTKMLSVLQSLYGKYV